MTRARRACRITRPDWGRVTSDLDAVEQCSKLRTQQCWWQQQGAVDPQQHVSVLYLKFINGMATLMCQAAAVPYQQA